MSPMSIWQMVKKRETSLKTFLILLLIFVLSLIFFNKLFISGQKVIVTPDFQTSDLWHYTFAEKYFLSDGLKHSTFQEYTDLLLNGMSLTADGQIAYLNPINYLIYKFFPMPFAFNLGYVLAFFIAGVGVFLVGRRMKLDRISSFFSAITFMFSGLMIFKISHYTLLQNIAYIPLIMFVLDTVIIAENKVKKITMSLILVILLNLQFSNGQFQLTFITFVALLVYVLISRILKLRKVDSFTIWNMIGSLILFFILSLPEIVSVGDLFLNSVRNSRLNSLNSLFPSFPIRNLLTFINPYIFGSPKNGSYVTNGVDGDIFWESNLYIGILPFLLFVYSLFVLKKNKFMKLITILIVFFFVLALGKNSPFYLISYMFPFSLFRGPTRFMVVVVIFVSLMAGFAFKDLKTKKIIKKKLPFLPFLVISITVFDLFLNFFNYHPIVEYKSWIEEPHTVSYLKKTNDNKYFSLGLNYIWLDYFTKKGWDDINVYKFLQNSIDPKLNLIYKIPSVQTFTSSFFSSKDDYYFLSLINDGIKYTDLKVTLSNRSLSFLEMAGVNYIITPYVLDQVSTEKLAKVYETPKNNKLGMTYKIYKFNNGHSDIYFAKDIKSYSNTDEFKDLMSDIGNDVALVESDSKLSKGISIERGLKKELIVRKNEPTQIEIVSSTARPKLLVFNRSFSLHWKAFVDGENTNIYRTNWKMQSVLVPQGKHIVKLEYDFPILRYTILIRSIVYLIIITTILLLIFRKFLYNRLPSLHL
ncbi:MAG: hypothetical protein HYW86_03635 [Candidatus Roizmanbacteria bacterium]|nr:MAG: hypothetical protein HYW86_03635 [Candidatus Roizmanbacteria bacterium]